MTDAVLFDFGGTLDADGLAWKERFAQLFAEEGAGTSSDRFDPVFYAADDALVGTIPETLSFADTVHQVAEAVAQALRPGDPALAGRVATRFLAEARAAIDANRPLLGRLSERYRLGIVSNFYGNLVTVCDNAELTRLFSVIVDSARVGLSKPDPRIFFRAVHEMGIEPADTVFVGDSLARDMAGARAAGMRHVWLTPDPVRQGLPCCPGDRVIRSLRELEGLLP